MDVSRVLFYCDDRKVGQILRLLAGVALQTPEVTPVVNAKPKNGKLEQSSNGNMLDMFAIFLKKKKLTEITPEIGREFCTSIGRSADSYGYLFKHARNAGLLRKLGKGSGSKWRVK
jgi:hypothetical protein